MSHITEHFFNTYLILRSGSATPTAATERPAINPNTPNTGRIIPDNEATSNVRKALETANMTFETSPSKNPNVRTRGMVITIVMNRVSTNATMDSGSKKRKAIRKPRRAKNSVRRSFLVVSRTFWMREDTDWSTTTILVGRGGGGGISNRERLATTTGRLLIPVLPPGGIFLKMSLSLP